MLMDVTPFAYPSLLIDTVPGEPYSLPCVSYAKGDVGSFAQ